MAQSLEIQPIHLDIDLDTPSESGEILLVAAYAPEVDNPVLDRTLSGRAAVKSDAGMPSPSIIVGLIEAGKEDEFGIETLLPATLEANRFDYDDLEAREALRQSDPDLFRKMVSGGYVDPPADQLSRALQTELRRFGCYTSTIDGIWGGGSRRAVGRYAAALNDPSTQVGQEPTPQLFRTILLKGDVECRQAAAAPASSSSTGNRPSSSSSSNRPTTTTPRRTQQPAQKAQPPKKNQSLRIVR